jgi:hypothetical protein
MLLFLLFGWLVFPSDTRALFQLFILANGDQFVITLDLIAIVDIDTMPVGHLDE